MRARFNRTVSSDGRSVEERVVDLMGTTAHVIVTGGAAGLADDAVERLHELEARWSRFRPDSEISRLNELPGVPVVVSSDTFTLVERAVAGWHLTAGRFDPTLLRELRDAGYDRSFELLGTGAVPRRGAEHPPPGDLDTSAPRSFERHPVETITLDPVVGSVCIGTGVEVDPGGIGKGLAADLVVEMLLDRGARGAMVSVGGDLRAEGDAPEGAGWIVAVAHPHAPDDVVRTLAFERGAVASSWRTKRTWAVDGEVRHHLIDPTTGAPAASGIAGVTVVCGQGWQAEVLAKAAFLGPGDEAVTLLDANGATGMVIADDHSTRELADLAPFTVQPG